MFSFSSEASFETPWGAKVGCFKWYLYQWKSPEKHSEWTQTSVLRAPQESAVYVTLSAIAIVVMCSWYSHIAAALLFAELSIIYRPKFRISHLKPPTDLHPSSPPYDLITMQQSNKEIPRPSHRIPLVAAMSPTSGSLKFKEVLDRKDRPHPVKPWGPSRKICWLCWWFWWLKKCRDFMSFPGKFMMPSVYAATCPSCCLWMLDDTAFPQQSWTDSVPAQRGPNLPKKADQLMQRSHIKQKQPIISNPNQSNN